MGLKLLGLLVATALSACASAPPAPSANLTAEQTVKIDQVCHDTMGLHARDEHFDACIEALSGRMAQRNHDAAVVQVFSQCRAEGFKAGSADLAECVVDHTDAVRTVSNRPGAPTANSSKSFFYLSNAEVTARERLTCAQLGFDPINGELDACVAELRSGFEAADAPMN